ncbi:oxidoreductase [Paenibacillus swuensis]|uniref:Oxidoreductase n=1 Tax=Paenibacillus swuensis TaxID=1178515 RepID=A0A172TGF8_9BACL|nr:SDR family oxidoreductase [Paenibacillus swuensis]ANE46138.1 oxidoreductase [Paenibacillus swuensis]
MDLTGKIVVITGASGGIGAETAVLVSARGAIPVLTGRNMAGMKSVAERLKGNQFGIYNIDVASYEDIVTVTNRIFQQYGTIDVWVNNAGFGIFESVTDCSMESFEEMMDVNYMGTVRCTKAVLPFMAAQGKGHIVNVASMAGKMATAKAAGYAATKHAVLGFTNGLRHELRKSGIQVSAVNPGPVATAFLDQADPSGRYLKKVGKIALRPEQVAAAIVKTIEGGRDEIDLPLLAGWGFRLYSLFPRWIDRVGERFLNRK